jgi:5-methylcytosine-specific restriction endonuclease McrA
MNVLALDASGMPRRWISFEDAITYHAKDMVVWSLGDTIARYRGGVNKHGVESVIETPSIIAVRGTGFSIERLGKVTLSNKSLFNRDRYVCAYCGGKFLTSQLSRDHVAPRCEGGPDVWTNVVTACKPCNLRKGRKFIEDIGMNLLYIPYEPNHYENMILQNRNILADQMEYLLAGVPKNSRLHT